MVEQTYQMPREPTYHDAIRKLRNQDPGNAEAVFNPLIQAMLENTEFVRLLAIAIAEQNAADHTAIRREIADSIRSAVDAIPTPDVSGQINTHDANANAHAALFRAVASQIAAAVEGAVPTSRTVNGKPLSGNISLTASDVGAAASGHSHTAAQVEALPISGGTLTGNLRLQSGNYGLVINLGDGDYVHISEPTDDVLELKGKSISFVTSQASGKPLPVNHGGTGATAAAAARTNLGAAAASHTHSASDITTTLPLSKGGTGVTNLAALKSLLGSGDIQFSLTSSVPSSLNNNQVAFVYV